MKRAEKALDHIQLFIVVTIIAGAISFILPTEKRERIFNRTQHTILSKASYHCEEIFEIIRESNRFSQKEQRQIRKRCLRAQGS